MGSKEGRAKLDRIIKIAEKTSRPRLNKLYCEYLKTSKLDPPQEI